MLPLRARVDLGAMAIKGYSAFLKALLEPHNQIGGGSYPSAEKQSVYSTASANWATILDAKGESI